MAVDDNFVKRAEEALGQRADEVLEQERKRHITHGRGERATLIKMMKDGYEPITHGKGYPDFMFIKGGRLTFVEVKSGNDKLSEYQQKVLQAFEQAGFEVRIAKYDERSGVKLHSL